MILAIPVEPGHEALKQLFDAADLADDLGHAPLARVPAHRDLAEGCAAEKEGRFHDALRLLRSLAASGDAAAAVELGNMYALGRGVRADDATAQSWYEMAERGGAVKGQAQFDIALELAAGRRVPKDGERATEWLTKASLLGFERAKRVLDSPSERVRVGFDTGSPRQGN